MPIPFAASYIRNMNCGRWIPDVCLILYIYSACCSVIIGEAEAKIIEILETKGICLNFLSN